MKHLIRLEEVMIFMLSVYLFNTLHYSWWMFFVLLLVPDLGMLGYVKNTEVGAFIYNVVHHRGIDLLIYFVGVFFKSEPIMLVGIILFAHSSLDRIFGYGLKYKDEFKHTHLS